MGMVRCALVVPSTAEVDDALLKAVADVSGKVFSRYGSGMFGTEVLATLYADRSGDLLIEARAVDVPVTAVLIRTGVLEDALAVRQMVGDQLRGWSEQMIRAQLEAEPDGDPQLMVALVMATGGGPVEPESLDLLQRAAAADDARVRDLAAYALQIAADLSDPPVVRKEQPSGLAEVLRPEVPVDGDEDWVTARPGSGARQIPRPVTWLHGPGAAEAVHSCGWDGDWLIAVAGGPASGPGPGWSEEIWTTEDGRTAVHRVDHPALEGTHIAVHGTDTAAVTAALTDAGAVRILDAPPAGLPRTAP
ncbi:hypothetical protein [Streptomyces chattanoogensis]|uniref:Uncharacterized protein n=1 Tax=Streptomyces chattanoogensis TaxID=66876 RepID=A0A0N0XV20_9ACTN|nr:hypothetical protein [Streptomyces chattanoogensis]KPC62878.1 hypothetical protein ADL29_16795 [Streptomyces chattanoogensis]